jgi:hypothetical protein
MNIYINGTAHDRANAKTFKQKEGNVAKTNRRV